MTRNQRIGIVTGASSGIGLATARLLTQHGWRLVVNARNSDRLHATIASSPHPHLMHAVVGDAALEETVDRLFSSCQNAFGRPDTVIVNAGRGLSGSPSTSSTADWDEMIRTNLLGAARLMRTAALVLAEDVSPAPPAPASCPRDIVVVGSVVGRHVSPFSSMYGSTKFAVHGLTEGLRREMAPKRVRVSLIEPAFVASDFQRVAGYDNAWFEGVVQRLGPVLEPDDVARSIHFVLSQPPHVHISDLLVRPTRQDYP